MKKKALYLIFAVSMMLTLAFGAAVFADSNNITLSKTVLHADEKAKATFVGAADEWFGLEAINTKVENTGYKGRIEDLPSDNTWEFTAPSKFGTYEIRLFVSQGNTDVLVGKAAFTVVPSKAIEGDLILSKTEVKLKEKVKLTINGLTKGEIDDGSWFGLEAVGTKLENTGYKGRVSDLPADNTWEFTAPGKFGKYEIRVFATSSNDTVEQNLFGKLEFAVVSSKAKEGDIKLSTTLAQPKEEMSVTINGLTKGEIDEGAWFGLEEVGAKLENTGYKGRISGLPVGNVWKFKAPEKPGKYEVRVFCSSDLSNEAEYEYGMFGKAVFTVGGAPAAEIVTGYEGISDWAVDEVKTARDQNLTTDKVMAKFGRELTREEFCELAVKLYERMTGKTAVPVEKNVFKDTKNTEILKAYKLGIVEGVSKDTFAPNNTVTRQEIATMLVRTLKAVMPKLETANAKFTQEFYDESEVADWALEGLRFLNANDIFRGANGYVLPNANTTREQGIALVNRVFFKFFEM